LAKVNFEENFGGTMFYYHTYRNKEVEMTDLAQIGLVLGKTGKTGT
jgi:hypothetical protein